MGNEIFEEKVKKSPENEKRRGSPTLFRPLPHPHGFLLPFSFVAMVRSPLPPRDLFP